MIIADEDLARITDEVWNQFLGVPVTRKTTPGKETLSPSLCFAGSIEITSADWEGTLLLQMGQDLARTTAAAMFCVEKEQASMEEITDSIGEVINIIGGNVKGLVEGACQLSLPTVLSGDECGNLSTEKHPHYTLTFSCEEQMFYISFFDSQE